MKKPKPEPFVATPTRATVLMRDHMHLSTNDINRRITRLRTDQQYAENDVTRLKGEMSARTEDAKQAKADADVLETLLEQRR
jgi:hypothetical protein